MHFSKIFFIACIATASTSCAFGDTFTYISPAGGVLPSTVSPVGGVVTDLVGINGVRVVAQVSAASEFIGYEPGYPNQQGIGYLLFAQQTGLTPAIIAALGGGLSSAAFRITLYDGDTKVPDFDYNQDSLYIGGTGTTIGSKATTSSGVNLGNFSAVNADQTTGTGVAIGTPGLGFGNNILDTGFFSSNDPAVLSVLYGDLVANAMTTQTINFQLRDNTFGDQYYDFTQGVDASLINVGSPPLVTSTPEPSSLILLGTGLLGLVASTRRKYRRR